MFFKKKKDGKFKSGGVPWNKGKKMKRKKSVTASNVVAIPPGYMINKHAVDTDGKPFIKLFGIGDLHWDLDETKVTDYTAILKFLEYHAPIDILVFAGDVWDLSFLAHWNAEKFDDVGHKLIANQLEAESIGMKELLKKFMTAAKAKRTVYMVGNHELWLGMYLNKYDKVHSHLGKNRLSKWLDFDGLGIEEIPAHENFCVGHMTLCHGDTYGTDNPAKRAIERSHRSKFFWHFHRLISWPGYTDADANEKIQAYSVPGFCKAASMEYLKKAANNWSNGFLLSYIKPSGHFTPHVQAVSPSGNFIYNDREFTNES